MKKTLYISLFLAWTISSVAQSFSLKDLKDITQNMRSEYTSFNITQHKWSKANRQKEDCFYIDQYILKNDLKTDYSAILIYSYNVMLISFAEEHVAMFNKLNKEIKTSCKQECIKKDSVIGQFTSYILNTNTKVYITVFTDETKIKHYNIYCVTNMGDDFDSWTSCEKYDNGVWYSKCKSK